MPETRWKSAAALTGERGIEIDRDENPDAVLLDINLLDNDSLGVLEKIMAIPAFTSQQAL